MLKDAIEKCPDDVWLDDRVTNRYWQIAYNVLYYTHLYLHVDEKSARPWPGIKSRCVSPSALTNPRLEDDQSLPKFAAPLERYRFGVGAICADAVDSAHQSSVSTDERGFGDPWASSNIVPQRRHMQHQAIQAVREE